MTATLDQLRAALQESAEYYGPDPHLTMREVAGRVGRRSRRRRRTMSGLLVVAAVGGGAVVASEHRTRTDGILQPGESRLIADDPHLPVSLAGLVRVSLTEWRMVPDVPIEIALPDADGSFFLRATCTDASLTNPVLFVGHGGAVDVLPCTPTPGPGDPPLRWNWLSDGLRIAPTRRPGPDAVTVEGRSDNASGTARIAVYAVTGQPRRPADMDTESMYAWTYGYLWRTTPFIPPPGRQNDALTISGRQEAGLRVKLVVRGPGTLRATVNGRIVNFECLLDYDGILACTDGTRPPFTDVAASDFGRPASVVFDPTDLAPGSGGRVGDLLTITVTPSGFEGDDWRLAVFRHSDGAVDTPPRGTWTRR